MSFSSFQQPKIIQIGAAEPGHILHGSFRYKSMIRNTTSDDDGDYPLYAPSRLSFHRKDQSWREAIRLTDTRWFNCWGKRVFGHSVQTFGFEDLVHGTGCHGMGSVGCAMGLRRLCNGSFRAGRYYELKRKRGWNYLRSQQQWHVRLPVVLLKHVDRRLATETQELDGCRERWGE
ncbi:hypothetical protein SADUNF_Sadunf11G0013400 [Salix dunnii]|uniref:Uncharacterized protein n=1 Tax=Salix dunnii TaxID=1413687 RepID=A0A835JSG6_9ROSI|nr:hypothetical protein SADUNF_Sadunf11G0013400 [Salix dunnii]